MTAAEPGAREAPPPGAPTAGLTHAGVAFRPDPDPHYGRMPRAFLRSVVTIAVAVCAWLIAAPAYAGMSAPQCDNRGAITFAPPPQLQPMEQSIDATDDGATCVERMLAAEGVHQGNAPPPTPTATEPVAPQAFPALLPPALSAVLPRDDVQTRAPAGVRTSLERPPRA